MTIRMMTIKDYAEVYTLWKTTPGMGIQVLEDSEEGIGRFLERNPYTCFVAMEEGKIVGVILSGHDGRRGFIYHTAVEKMKQVRHIGKALVAAVEEAMKKEGIHKISLAVFKDNRQGNLFWERQGFLKQEDLVYRQRDLYPQNI
ncbi:MAG: GNAT family N-acetyltransferase [Treponema sp.]|jgi:ribosomal protein S18 acetylase RimI-like enzyme|nr:GNAT family N-acetyltransferase [Treponema sp.]